MPATTKYTETPTETVADFRAVQLKVASPEEILSWSHGEVLKPETINYRTQKAERDGLFDERIFGPTKDFQCYCGKYKGIRFRGITCDKCGVEITKAAVRRQRMGHIDLAVPVVHTWYLQSVTSQLSYLLDMTVSDLEKVVYFAAYVVLDVDESARAAGLQQLAEEYQELRAQLLDGKEPQDMTEADLKKLEHIDTEYTLGKKELEGLKPRLVISELQYHDLSLRFGAIVSVGIGAEAIRELLQKIDLDAAIPDLEVAARTASLANKRRAARRLKLFNDLKSAGISPEWFVLTRVAVIPPDLRPMVQLDGGRFAASDLNDLYRRVLNRNNRLKKLLNSGAPEVIVRNEKRMLQEAVDALIDNSARRGRAAAAATGLKRRLKSLSDMLKGKQGRFRANLLGKRVDYSGRSVIVVGPNLQLHQCGIPKTMALELFKPFVVGQLVGREVVANVKNAQRLIDEGHTIVWDILEELTASHVVLLNRAPTLHRLGIQAFQPVLVEGKAIQIHPLVCVAYNADFDGDQMAVHLPLSKRAQDEARKLMLSSHNLLKPASGEVIVGPNKDMLLGTYYLTVEFPGATGEGRAFSSIEEAVMAYDQGVIALHAKVRIRVNGEVQETTVGRAIFNRIVPAELGYQNVAMSKKAINTLVQTCFDRLGNDATAQFVDDIKNLGFKYAEKSGITFSLSDIKEPASRKEHFAAVRDEVAALEKQFRRGLISAEERYVQSVQAWLNLAQKLEGEVLEMFIDTNPLTVMFKSGARGGSTNLNQIAGMKGTVVNPSGQYIEIPVTSNFKGGLDVYEYFLSTHGARKGIADKSLRTADAGYLTRRLVDIVQDVVVSIEDCKTTEGIYLHKSDFKELGESFARALEGRYLQGEQAGIASGTYITPDIARQLAEADIEKVYLRSVLRCTAPWGVCQKCYGSNLSAEGQIPLGEAVGIIAAQAIGEPGTQLTMKTFHLGGVAQTGGDITAGLPRVEELFEARIPRTPAVMAEIDGKVNVEEGELETVVTIQSGKPATQVLEVPKAFSVVVAAGDKVGPRDVLAQATGGKTLRSTVAGTVSIADNVITVTANEKESRSYSITGDQAVIVASGATVTAGQALTEGHLDLQQLLKVAGREVVERYIVHEVQKIYVQQGQSINHRHLEVIVRTMLSKVAITDAGSTEYVLSQVVDQTEVRDLMAKGKLQAEQMLLGITFAALATKSFLSAASFQRTTERLIDAAVQGKRDELRGLKENVIIGKLIPAGTGFDQSRVAN